MHAFEEYLGLIKFTGEKLQISYKKSKENLDLIFVTCRQVPFLRVYCFGSSMEK